MKKLEFFDQKHRLTPLEKCNFWHFEEFCFYTKKNAIFRTFKNFCFYSKKKRFFFLCKVIKHFFYPYFDQIQIKKNLAFFDQKHGLTPLEKCNFWHFEEFCFYTKKNAIFRTFKNFCFYSKKKRFFFLCKVIKHFFYPYFDQIQIKKNLAFFDRKHGLTPLEKCHFLDI